MSILIACGGDVGRQPLSRKSRLRELMLALRPFNLRMQALRRPRTREWFDKGIARQSGAAMMSVPMPLVPEIPIAISCLR